MSKITWDDCRKGDALSASLDGRFTIRFRLSADGKPVRLRADGEYKGSFSTIAAAKRHAARLAKG